MFEKLHPVAAGIAADRVARHIDRLLTKPLPPGVAVERVDGGMALTGKRLRRRIINEPDLRNFSQ